MYRRIKKYFKPICFISFVPFATPLINSATNTSLNIAITSKVDINTIFGDTVNMSCVQTPTADDILSYLGNIGIQQGYPNVMNQLMISNWTDNNVSIIANPSSREFTGSTTLIYNVIGKTDLSTLVTQENISWTMLPVISSTFWSETNSQQQIDIYRAMLAVLPDLDVNQVDITNIIQGQTIDDATITLEPTSDSSYYFGNSFTRDFRIGIINCLSQDQSQKIVVPVNGNYQLESWGAQGGCNDSSTSRTQGGNGAYTVGQMNFLKSQSVYAYVGGRNNQTSSQIPSRVNWTALTGGWNGGGSAGNNTSSTTGLGWPGGGASDFRLLDGNDWDDKLSLNSRIMVAAGGGGGSSDIVGGGITGVDGINSDTGTKATGATQTNRGTGFIDGGSLWTGQNGSFGNSGSSKTTVTGGYGNTKGYGGGSGGGYYGGGAGGTRSGGGNYCSPGGSTSFISGLSNCVAIANPLSDVVDNRTPKTTDNTTALTFNNIIGTSQDWVFANATMIDGATEQIQPNGSTTVGHSGNGYARVTFLSAS